MAERARKSDPQLWARVKRDVTRGSKGGRPGQWSARKAQLAVQIYKKRGGGYVGPKSRSNSLAQWTRQDWTTKSGRKSTDTGERYLPRNAIASLNEDEYRRTTARKRRDTRAGKRISLQPRDVARKTKRTGRLADLTKSELMARARKQGTPGRSRMTKAQLARALSR